MRISPVAASTPDLDEMGAEGRLLILLAEIAELDRVLGRNAAVARRLGERHAAIARADAAVGERNLGGVEAELARHGLAQLDAGGIDAGGRAVCTPLPARARRHRIGRIAQAHGDPVERHAHHLGRGLGDDRVGAGADVGHVGLDRDEAAGIEPDPRRRFHDQIVAERGGDAHADQPAPVARPARLRAALAPAEALRADAQALDEAALREWPCGLLGIDLGVVADAELDRVQTELLRHLVHGDLERHHARRLAGRTHRIALGQIERGQARRRHPVLAGIEQAGLLHRPFGAAAGQVAGPALVADGADPAVRRGPDADALDRGGPMRGVVEHQRAA